MNLRRPRTKYPPSPRHLALRHGHRILKRLKSSSNIEDAPGPIGPGEERLYSFYVPGLEAGLHRIDVEQNIIVDPQTTPVPPEKQKTVNSSLQFNVIAPRFSLPDDAINSVYPPESHEDRAEVLPHIVFTDPTLPWERIASWNSEKNHPPDYDSNRVPWLAVLVFTQDELRLDSSESSAVFADPSFTGIPTPSTTFSYTLPLADISKTRQTATSIVYDPVTDGAATTTDAIFLKSKLFNDIFTKYDKDGKPDSSQTSGQVLQHRFLSHLRHIHMGDISGSTVTDGEDHVFSVVVSHRTGPVDITQPTTVIAHLVNIEGVEAMPFPVTSDFVVMSSLYSWQYTCLPPNSLNVADAFSSLGETQDMLRPNIDGKDVSTLNGAGDIGKRLSKRLNDGYSMVRYRVQTGEVSGAFTRSPFGAVSVNFPAETPWPVSSTTGTKLQILDQELNMMDITYSAAWNLGKTLGLADQAFAAALSRVRKQIFDIAMNEAQIDAIRHRSAALNKSRAYKTRIEVLETLAHTVKKLGTMPAKKGLQNNPQGMVNRWYREEPPQLDLTYQGDEIDPLIDKYLDNAARLVASTSDVDSQGDPTKLQPYNEFNTPFSTDWMIVLQWVLNRLHLVDVPPHYLITDPSHLPLESLRFFAIDSYWTDAIIDGGLSLANHLDQEDDRLRNVIKCAIKWYQTTPIPGLNYFPPIPTYGFFLRSALVTKFPDLIVDLKPQPSPTEAPVILLHRVVDQGTMLCLLREAPVAPDFTSLLLREPPHQQYFTAAININPETMEMAYKQVYADTNADDPQSQDPIKFLITNGEIGPHGSLYIWGSSPTTFDVRILNVENFAFDLYKTITPTSGEEGNPDLPIEPCATSALVGLQLNEKNWQLDIALPYKGSQSTFTADCKPRRTITLPAPRPPKARPILVHHPHQIKCAPHPPYHSRKRLDPVKLRHPPPHYRIPRLDPRLQRPRVVDPPAGAPNFSYTIFPVGESETSIPMNPGKQDLIFSINYVDGAQEFDLLSCEIHVPLGVPALMDNYTGSGVAMLSNLRFNVIAKFNTMDELVLTLIPRSSTSRMVPVTRIQEMSFMLSGVVVKKYNQDTTVPILAVEHYNNRYPWGKNFNVLLSVPLLEH